jgi:GNAT superfamily N-acetyltransferase
MDREAVSRFLAASYWAPDRPPDDIDRSLAHSVAFALLCDGRQVGMARVVTDYATFAWLCDVFIEPAHRGRGLGTWLISVVLEHPELAGVRTWLLASRDSRELYARFGFTGHPHPERIMIRRRGRPVP